ncbi:Uncharacterized protein dnl_30350 [Desulfonema limicola]|uniref:Uncharacterized protein n=1 Tax=Desulfonema limicola TaxID=45656 RepID=A0A975B8G1_9BACT|nr:hypothetical protein [Desulfonema limicola]QTA80722.1 Uncharacterized protein dnl_30350 [Desulfonema limicola]
MAALAARAGTGACPYGCYEIFDEVLTSMKTRIETSLSRLLSTCA